MFHNFEEIKASNPISEVVEKLGLNLNKSGASLRGKCPVCESTGDRNLVITPDKNLYFCFSEKKGGDTLQLIAHVLGMKNAKEAAEWLQGPAKQDSTGKVHRSKEKTTDGEKPAGGFKPLDYIQPDHPAVAALGIEPGDADRMGLGYVDKGYMKGLVVVPVRLTDGRLIGYIGIQEGKTPPSWKW